MSSRLYYVPKHSIVVVREGKQVDTLAEYNRTGKAFKFTADELKTIPEDALRMPADEGVEDGPDELEVDTALVSEKAQDGDEGQSQTDTEPKAAAKPAKKAVAAKDVDL